jgi:hypothetical protein
MMVAVVPGGAGKGAEAGCCCYYYHYYYYAWLLQGSERGSCIIMPTENKPAIMRIMTTMDHDGSWCVGLWVEDESKIALLLLAACLPLHSLCIGRHQTAA